MEPPAKRMRVLQSVDNDHSDPNQVIANIEQQQRFKDRLESIFAKYENMHESMSDEIDMVTNEVVVDRGHLRRLNRQITQQETMLLDMLGMGPEPALGERWEEDKAAEDSEDELAPARIDPGSTSNRGKDVLPSKVPEATATPRIPPNATATPNAIPAPPIGAKTNPAANLMQLVQFPQTSEGQQAQTTFYATLTKTINEAVEQAVVRNLAKFQPSLQSLQLPHAIPPSEPATPAQPQDRIAPATDPKWFFPPLSAVSRQKQLPASSPLARVVIPPRSKTQQAQDVNETVPSAAPGNAREKAIQKAPSSATDQCDMEQDALPTVGGSPLVEQECKQKRSRAKKRKFTAADEIYISKLRNLHGQTWPAIRESRVEWKNWPLATFYARWATIRHQNLHLAAEANVQQEQVLEASTEAHRKQRGTASKSPRSQYTSSNHLPTPNSSVVDDLPDKIELVQAEVAIDAAPPSSHFDEEELELLSLADADEDHAGQLRVDDNNETPFHSNEDEDILPSVENEMVLESSMLHQIVANRTHVEDSFDMGHLRSSSTVKTEPVPSPLRKPRKTLKYANVTTIPDSQSTPAREVSSVRPGSPSKASSSSYNPPRDSASIDLVGSDRVQIQSQPTIKREASSPPPSRFAYSSPQTSRTRPAPRPTARAPCSASVMETTRLSAKAFRRQVKASWAKGRTPKRRSSGIGIGTRRGDDVDAGSLRKKKRVWDEVRAEESPDELA